MKNEIILAIIQAITEFLPISSDGHLALASNLLGQGDLFFITILHIASLFAVLIFTRKEIIEILKFNSESIRMIKLLIIVTIPGALVGFFLLPLIETAFNSLLITGIGFYITGMFLLISKFPSKPSKLNSKKSLIIGLFQSLALFPGISRSGTTISTALLLGIDKEKATKFSFLAFIPLAIGAFSLEFINSPRIILSADLIVSFIVCFVLSLFCLNLLNYIIKKDKFWMFSIYCFIIGTISIMLHLV